MDLSELIASHLRGEAGGDAIEFRGRWFTWNALRTVARRIEDALSARGLGRGAPVGLIARNRPALVAAMLAVIASRRRIVMLHAFQSPAALAADLRRLALPAVIGDEADWSDDAMAAMREAGALALALGADADATPVRLSDGTRAAMIEAIGDPDVAIEMLTSGTTGAPKRIAIRWSTLNAAAADLVGTDPDRTAGSSAPPEILPFPIGNISGLYYLIPAVGLGRRLVLLERFHLEEWLEAVRRHRCTYAALPPAAIRMLMDAGLHAGDLGQLTAIGVGAAPLDPELQARFEERFALPVLVGYGATEFCGVIATWTPDDHRLYASAKRGSVGRARGGIALRVVDRETGAECATGTVGVVEARVPRVGPDFIRTTDLGRLDEDGFLFLHGRADEVINRGGFKVDPARIVSALCSHAAVADAGVVGIANDRLGQVPAAAVELRPHQAVPSEQDLHDFLRGKLRTYELPDRIRILEALPRTPSMKIRLADLRVLLG